MALWTSPKTSDRGESSLTSLSTPRVVSHLSLPDFIREFGLSLSDVTPKSLLYFVASRSLLGVVERLNLPTAYHEDIGSGCVLEENTDSTTLLNAPNRELSKSSIPSAHMEICPATISDLPNILSYQKCYPDDVLLYNLAIGNLSHHAMRSPGEELGENPIPDNQMHESAKLGKEQDATMCAYLLLDISQSMNGEVPVGEYKPDVRGVVGRGLGLAFLLNAQHRGAEAYLRPFSSKVGNLESYRGRNTITPLVKQVLNLKNDGLTILQGALESAVNDLKERSTVKRIDIMLITDGLSFLSKNPLGETVLHTFLVGDGCAKSEDNQIGVYEKLDDWSATLKAIANKEFDDIACPREADIRAFQELVQDIAERIHFCRSEEELAEFEHVITLAQSLAEAYLRHSNAPNSQLQSDLEMVIEHAQAVVSNTTVRNDIAYRTAVYENRCQLFDELCPSLAGKAIEGETNPDMPLKSSLQGGGTEGMLGLTALLKILYLRCKRALQKRFH